MDAAHSSSLPLPLPLPQTYAPGPVWSDSTTAPIRFAPMPKKAVVRLWHRGRDFDRGTHEHGRHGGAVGPTALQGHCHLNVGCVARSQTNWMRGLMLCGERTSPAAKR